MRKSPLGLALGLLLASATLGSAAGAAAPRGAGVPSLELVDGSEGRPQGGISARPGAASTRAGLRRLEARLGGRTTGLFDVRTDVPRRLWGFSVPTPGASASAEIARKASLELLRDHLQLLAPGARPEDLAPLVDHLDRSGAGQRTVGFAQTWRGMLVLGGHVSVRFQRDRLFGIASSAFPDVDAQVPRSLAPPAVARDAARAWILEGAATARTASEVEGPFVLPIATDAGLSYEVVLRVRVEAERPVGLYDVYVHAETGAPIAREQRLLFETAHLSIEAWDRSPWFGPRVQVPAARVTVDLGEAQATGQTAPDGSFSFEGPLASGTATLLGDQVRVRNMDGEDLQLSIEATDGQEILWSEEQDEEADAQLNAFVHAGLVNDAARVFAPDLSFLEDRVEVQVNIEDTCNAYSDLRRIHFFKAGAGCENTARIADVVHHEYGHSIHGNAYLFCGAIGAGTCVPDGALSEGYSDYLAATMTGDPAMGRGFFMDDAPLRDIDPADGEAVWPVDLSGEVHYDGLIIGGALWDLRALLSEELGEGEGVAIADRLAYQGIMRAGNMPEMLPEMLFADDDDGDLGNGTPHQCAIQAAMQRHGLRPLGGEVRGPSLAPPSQDGYEVSLEVPGLSAACGESLDSAFLSWADTVDPTRSGLVDLVVGDDGVARGRIPAQQEGRVIRFDVRAQTGGADLTFPQNPADPVYQLYVGEVTPIYCTTFETDPFGEGWRHELVSGEQQEGADDWMWGAPNGTDINGDPASAFSGTFAVGQDFSPEDNWNGLYQPDKHSALTSPVLTIPAGFEQVRLQYRRWLNVEDGYFDRARILADGEVVWQNLDSDQGTSSSVHHQDREWRFHDVDVSAQAADGSLELRWDLQSDAGLELGGWTIDDVCVVGYARPTSGECTTPPCGPPPATGATTSAAAGGGDDDGAGGGDGLAGGEDPEADGCGCEVPASPEAPSRAGLVATALLALAAARRRRRIPRG